MSKKTSFLFFIILLVSTLPLPQAEALGIGPPSFELDLQMDGSNSTTVYITSDGLTGELIVGKETLPFRIEPSRINMTRDDVNAPVELTFYGNETLEPGVYEGKVTFLAYTGGFVAYGIKIRAKINLLGEAQEEEQKTPIEEESEPEPEPQLEPELEPQPEPEPEPEPEPDPEPEPEPETSEEEPETPVEEETEEEPEAETKPESEEGPDLPDLENLNDWAEGEQEISEEEPEEEPRANSEPESEEEPEPESQEIDYAPYLMGGAAMAALVSIVIWWKRR